MALPSLLLASALAGAGSPPPLPLETAEAEVLERWDAAAALDARPSGPVEVRDRAALAWLRAALGPGLPANPFRRGTPDHREAEAVRALLQAAPERRAALLQALRPLRAGSRAALWRWGQALVRQGALPRALRHAWEDLLLEGGPALLRGFALRHALCFALAEGDAARFAALRERYGEGADDVFGQVQPAFALLGAPAPRLRLWHLPGLEEDARPLSELGARRIRVQPLEEGLPEALPDQAWLAVSLLQDLPEEAAGLEGSPRAAAEGLAARLRSAGRSAWFAPSRGALQALGLQWFPVLLELDAEGRVASIRMGDAARVSPGPSPAGRP